ncbi:Multiple RNA-binding domain-containing protein 1 [Dichanthelium oligosanthes]|uniref:Multiple RNA-binding domain-containing protein 1 n=1 Tax=Dichanthelium oligosanthes TaxID=888268 RepID=A0A1E5V3C3_9POAL|nr:Multiple RNA-binding domain-containing protein 1 [Dichanthelium oligosanthes]
MSSRLCVKNLPKGADERRLREVFSRKGEVTDAKVIRTKDGKTRQFAFIGFRTNEEAEEALKYFNNTYIDTCKITCEVARKIGDPDAPRPWSRHSLKKPEYGSKDKTSAGDVDALPKGTKVQGTSADVRGSKGSVAKDPMFQEFLEVMQPRSKAKMWANDTSGTLDAATTDSVVATKESKRTQKNVPASENDSSSEDSSDEEMANDLSSEDASEELQTESKQNNDMTDADFFKSKIKKDWSDSESDDEDSGGHSNTTTDDGNSSDESQDADNQLVDLKGHLDNKNNVDKNTHMDHTNLQEVEDPDDKESEDLDGGQKETEIREDKDKEDEDAASIADEKKLALETGRLFFCNLPYATTEDDLAELCSQYGDVEQAHIVVDKTTKLSTGRGYVLFSIPDSAVRALDELDSSSFQGRLLRVKAAKPLNNKKLEFNHATVEVKLNLKQQKLEQKKASEISGDTRAWNSFYMRQDTVWFYPSFDIALAFFICLNSILRYCTSSDPKYNIDKVVENIARKNGISKSELLDREADDLAVRIALGETHVIAETKKYLSRTGVNVAALEEFASKRNEKSKRSNHVILVKNLPFSTSEEELAAMFYKHGSLDKIILPPTRVFALVVFVEATEAQHAFKKLLYTRYKDTPLYLEWAPEDILSPTSAPVEEDEKNVVGERIVTKAIVEQTVEGVSAEEIDPDRVESRSVFVKNLNFKTTDESLKQHFSTKLKSGSLKSVKVKKHVKNGKNVSMGFGFVEFDSVETATSVCKELQGTVLDGHALILQLCHGKKDGQATKKNDKDKSSTKLLVRNVAFEATEKDLRQLFSPFGQIKSLRLPMKFGSHRGFGFVEYVTKQEAQNALQALASTHLYGRHLVIERAKEGETLEELRARTAAQFVDEHNGFQRLSKKRKQNSLVDEGSVKFSRIVE